VVEVGRFLLYAVPTVIVLYALIDALQTRRDDVRSLPKWLWLIVILLVPLFGAIAWIYAGRPPRVRSLADSVDVRRGPVAPDDDPAFLRTLDDATWSQRMRQRRERGSSPEVPPAPEPPPRMTDGSADSTDSADH
jgi:hypothetical protein